MLKAVRYVFLGCLAVALLAVASANRQVVTLRLLPEEMDRFFGWGWSVDLPLFLILFGFILVGLLVGLIWEWMREAKMRAEAGQHRRKVGLLERELGQLRAAKDGPQDEVLALLEKSGK